MTINYASFVSWPLEQYEIDDNGVVMARRQTSITFYNGHTVTFIITNAPITIVKTFYVARHKGTLKQANDVTDLFNKQGMRHSDTVQSKVMVEYKIFGLRHSFVLCRFTMRLIVTCRTDGNHSVIMILNMIVFFFMERVVKREISIKINEICF